MGNVTILALRVVIGLVMACSLLVQVVVVADLADVPVELALFVVPGILTIQVTAVCIWQLLTMARRGTVFSHDAFRYVDIVFGAAVTASLLTFGLAVALAPGDAAPGIVGMICGVSLIGAGIALIVLVLRTLLAQAVARDREAHHLRAELEGVI
jgi:hypothetical protein